MENGTFYNENKANYICRIKIAVIVFVTFLLQNNPYFFAKQQTFPVMLMIPLVVCIGMFEREIWGMLFGLFAGILLDAFSAESLCFHSIALACIGFVSGLLVTGIFRNNLKTCFIFTTAALFIYNTVYFIVYYCSAAGDSADYVYINFFLASVLYSLIFTFAFYFIIRMVTSKKKTD